MEQKNRMKRSGISRLVSPQGAEVGSAEFTMLADLPCRGKRRQIDSRLLRRPNLDDQVIDAGSRVGQKEPSLNRAHLSTTPQ